MAVQNRFRTVAQLAFLVLAQFSLHTRPHALVQLKSQTFPGTACKKIPWLGRVFPEDWRPSRTCLVVNLPFKTIYPKVEGAHVS